jgi:hypothetical protein
MTSPWLYLLVATALAGCNQVAGIADFRTGELDASEAGGDDASAPGQDAGGSDAEGGAADDASSQSDGGTPLPACNAPQVALVIAVSDSTPGQFTGVSDGNGLFQLLRVGNTFSGCVAPGTMLDLRAEPGDPSNAVHDWGACGTGRRCEMTIQAATVLDVDLR